MGGDLAKPPFPQREQGCFREGKEEGHAGETQQQNQFSIPLHAYRATLVQDHVAPQKCGHIKVLTIMKVWFSLVKAPLRDRHKR